VNEKLIHDYWLGSGNNIFTDFEVEIQTVAGGVVIFKERATDIYGDFELRTVDTLDVLAWVYSKLDIINNGCSRGEMKWEK